VIYKDEDLIDLAYGASAGDERARDAQRRIGLGDRA
jgi:hypothetical protein